MHVRSIDEKLNWQGFGICFSSPTVRGTKDHCYESE